MLAITFAKLKFHSNFDLKGNASKLDSIQTLLDADNVNYLRY